MEELLTSENLAIVVLVAWVGTLKLDVSYYRKQHGVQWDLINKMVNSVNSVRDVLHMSLDGDDK